jgi:hypothetical protein
MYNLMVIIKRWDKAMKIQKTLRTVVLVGAAVGVSGLTAAFGNASQSISLQGEVPLICRVSLAGGNGDFNADGQANLGSTSEFCNSGKGYRVFARAEGVVDGASLIVDGVRFPLQSGSEFLMVNSNTPNSTSRAIVYDAGETDGGGRLSLRIVAN